MTVKIYHNPRCSKSRQTLQLLQEQNVVTDVVEYLKTPPSKSELKAILAKLGLKPRELMRTKEAEYKEQKLDDQSLTDEQLIDAMLATPKLIERPIVVTDKGIALGRPPENILKVL